MPKVGRDSSLINMYHDGSLINIYHEFHHSDMVVRCPPKATNVLTGREMFLPSELGHCGPGASKDQYQRTRGDGGECFCFCFFNQEPMLFSPSCISGKPFIKTINKTLMSWAEKNSMTRLWTLDSNPAPCSDLLKQLRSFASQAPPT